MRGGFWRYFDFWLLGAVTILVIIGITMIRSALAGNFELTVTTPLVNRQIIFALIGFVLLIGTAGIDYRLWSSVSSTLYFGMIIVLLALNIIGAALFGSARWFRTTLVFIQPSEFAKLVVILSISHFFVQHIHEMNEPKWTIRSLIMAMGITVWVILQPNLSTSIVLLVLWFVLLWLAGVPLKHLILYAVVGLLVLAITFPVLVQFQIIQDYQVKRILNFVTPDPNARYGDIYNIQQALISIGSGGLFGQGYGHGSQVQLRFLKVRWSDFIFSTTAHELGFVGAVLIIGLIVFIVWRCLYAARISRDTYGALISYGVATLIAFQAIVNIGVNLNLMPATGLTLPFVSYGGSSLVANMIAIGLVESVIMRHKALEL
ncbi:MAG: FtsW/RodA/SpoVE family cell cycle protein [Chloroflexi bacterium]|nr:FtsW/RodA/SpoVE family cell cycle protein [Chloroflexota bacterium]